MKWYEKWANIVFCAFVPSLNLSVLIHEVTGSMDGLFIFTMLFISIGHILISISNMIDNGGYKQ